jgi:hypothetical protein
MAGFFAKKPKKRYHGFNISGFRVRQIVRQIDRQIERQI